MTVIAYCRVSTDEQADEGFSIEGQAQKLREYAHLHELGPVRVIEDPGQSGKDLNRPGIQQVLALVEDGGLDHVLVWRLDRLSRNLGDLIDLADRFGSAGVGLHSFTERLDLSSPTGRMFYNILGTFAQFYREQLAENVRMGMQQAVREGKWINRPKFGYDLIDGELVPNGDAPTVRRIFDLRSKGWSFPAIERATGVPFSTANSIINSRIYLGEVLLNGQWYPGRHEPIVTEAQFRAAHSVHVKGIARRATHVLSGRVRCGLCGRVAGVKHNGNGSTLYRCWHRGSGCKLPARSVLGMERAALMGIRLLSGDADLQTAIREELQCAPAAPDRRATAALTKLTERRQKLLQLYYADKISIDAFEQEESEIARQIQTARAELEASKEQAASRAASLEHWSEVEALLQDLDVDRISEAATYEERLTLVAELVEGIWIFPDHFRVKVTNAPELTVLPGEVGLKATLPFKRVGERTRTSTSY